MLQFTPFPPPLSDIIFRTGNYTLSALLLPHALCLTTLHAPIYMCRMPYITRPSCAVTAASSAMDREPPDRTLGIKGREGGYVLNPVTIARAQCSAAHPWSQEKYRQSLTFMRPACLLAVGQPSRP